MKFLMLIIILSLTSSLPILGGYQRVETSEVNSSPEIQNLAEFGMKVAVSKAISEGKITSQDFEVSQIFSVYRQITTEDISYKYECEYTNNEGIALEATFEVNYNIKSSERKVMSLNYKVKKSGAIQLVEQSFTEVSASEIEFSAEVENTLNFGIDQLLQRAKADKRILRPVEMVNLQDSKVYRQVISNALFYKCHITLEIQEGTVIEAAFTVYYQPTIGTKYLTDYSYQVKIEQKIVYLTTTQAKNDTYRSLDVNEVKNNEQVYGILEFGASAVAQLAIKGNRTTNAKYEISSVAAASTQLTTAGRFYNFTCELQNQQGILISMVFTVLYQKESNKKTLCSYSYNIISTKKTTIDKLIGAVEEAYMPVNTQDINSDIVAKGALNGGISQILRIGIDEKKIPDTGFSVKQVLEAYNQIMGNGLFYKFSCEIVNKDKVSVKTNFTVYYQYQINETKLTSYSYDVSSAQTSTGTSVIKPVLSAYKAINISEVQKSKGLQAVLQFGVKEIVRIGVKNSKIPSSQYEIKEIKEAYYQDVKSGSFYKFTCELNNGEGVSVKTTFTVYKSLTEADLILSAYSFNATITTYTITTENVEPVEGAYTAMDILEVLQSEKTQGILQFGVQQLVNKGIQAGKIPVFNYKMKTVFGAYKQSAQWGEFYKFEVLLDNDAGVTVKGSFVIYYKTATGEKTLVTYSYDVQIVREVETSQVVKAVEANYKAIEVSKVEKDQKIKANLDYGIDVVLEKGRSDEKISDSEFRLSKVLRAFTQSVALGVFYRFEVELSSLDGVKIVLNFEIFEEGKTDKKTVSRYSYKVITTIVTTNVAGYVEGAFTQVNLTEVQYSNEVQSCLQYGVQQIVRSTDSFSVNRVNSIYRQVVEGALYYKFDVELTIKGGKVVEVEFTIFYQPVTKEKDLEAYSYKSKSIKTSSEDNTKTQRYTAIAPTEIQKNMLYQGILQYGLQECIKNLMSYKVIKSANLKVSQIVSIYKQATNYENYKFKVQLTNEASISMKVSFEVEYQKSTQKKTLVAYAVEGSSDNQAEDVLLVDYEEGRYQDLLMGNYEKVGGSEVKANVEIQLAIQYGLEQTLQRVMKKEKFGAVDFKLKEVKNVYREIVDRKSYKVELSLGNSKGETVEMVFFVDYSSELKVKKVVAASYIVY